MLPTRHATPPDSTHHICAAHRTLPIMLAKSSAIRVQARPARGSVVAAAASRPVWLPNVNPPPHLKGELAGDNGEGSAATAQ
jgi:hypothetical protein